jgi:hypothetical protein
MLYEKTGKEEYNRISKDIQGWIKTAYNPQTGVFNRGIDEAGRIDTIFATDVQSLAIMAFGVDGLKGMGVDVDRLLEVTEEKASVMVDYTKPDGTKVKVTLLDFNDQKDMGTPEWTAQMVIAYRLAGNNQKADEYLAQLEKMLYKGTLPYATKENAPTGHGWNTPFGKISLAGITYYYLAKYGDNPLTLGVEGTGYNLQEILNQQLTLDQNDYPVLIEGLKSSDPQGELTSAQANLNYIIQQIDQSEKNLKELNKALENVQRQVADLELEKELNKAREYTSKLDQALKDALVQVSQLQMARNNAQNSVAELEKILKNAQNYISV